MIPSKASVVSAISPDEEAEMDRLTEPSPEDGAEAKHAEIDAFVAGLDHEQLEYAANKIRDAIGAEGELEQDVETPPTPEESGSTKNC